MKCLFSTALLGGQFNGPTYFTRPTEDHHRSTVDQFLSDFDGFVGTSFHIAEMLEDTIDSTT